MNMLLMLVAPLLAFGVVFVLVSAIIGFAIRGIARLSGHRATELWAAEPSIERGSA